MGPRNRAIVLDAGSEVLRDVAIEINFRTQFAIGLTGFVRTIATRRLITVAVEMVGGHNADIADQLQLRDVAMITIV